MHQSFQISYDTFKRCKKCGHEFHIQSSDAQESFSLLILESEFQDEYEKLERKKLREIKSKNLDERNRLLKKIKRIEGEII